MLAFLLAAPVWAEGTGIVISGDDEANINVTIDPALISELQIKRGNGQMTIRIPETLSTGNSALDIEPKLKSSSSVQVQDSGHGRMVTVNSERVYLSIQDLNGVKYKDAEPEKKPTGVAALPAPAKSLQTKVVATPVLPTPTPKVEAPEPANILQALPKAATPLVNTLAQTPKPEPEEAIGTFAIEEGPPVIAGEKPDTALQSEEASLSLSPEPEVPDFLTEGEDGIPLDLLHRQREANTVTSTNTLGRLVLGLILVLAMAVGFIKLGLPRLMAKYPAFFVNLKQRSQLNNESFSPEFDPQFDMNTALESSPVLEKAESAPATESIFQKLTRKTRPTFTEEPDSKRAYLERITLPSLFPTVNYSTGRFEVISSQSLGKGKELHLVSIKGRQLVVATTPYSVNLIADVTEGASAESGEETLGNFPAAKTHAFIDESQMAEREPVRNIAEADVAVGTPEGAPHHKYLRQDVYKKYLSRPQAFSLEEDTDVESLSEPPGDPQQQARTQQRQVIRDLKDRAARRPRPTEELPFVDAEEVVVLQDYDDVYEA